MVRVSLIVDISVVRREKMAYHISISGARRMGALISHLEAGDLMAYTPFRGGSLRLDTGYDHIVFTKI